MGAPFAARLATIPSLVVGVYAPPVNVKPHFLHFQTPTLSRLTFAKPHCGHLCAFLSSTITLAYRFLTVAPLRSPNPRVGPTFLVLPNLLTTPVFSVVLQLFLAQFLWLLQSVAVWNISRHLFVQHRCF